MSGRVRLKENGILNEDLPTLLELTLNYISKNLTVICAIDLSTEILSLREGVIIPNEICDRFLKYHQELNNDINDAFVSMFRDPTRTPLKYISLRNCSITDAGIELLSRHNLESLSMWYCNNVTKRSWDLLIENCNQLKSLELGPYVDIIKYTEPNEKAPIDFQINLPYLKKLVLNDVVLQPSLQFSHLKDLLYLDLTACLFAEFSLNALVNLPNLHTLILFNIWPMKSQIPALCKLRTLRVLDISVAVGSITGTYTNSDSILALIVESLPLLTHLDISGTNLAGTGVAQFQSDATVKSSDIPGLVSRANNPLQFLGLYNAEHAPCRRYDIPAITISGDANEKQILTAAVTYQDRPAILTKVLNDLYQLLRVESCSAVHTAVDVVLTAMDRHVRVKHMQISGSATLFYIVKGREKNNFGKQLKNHIIRTLLNGMAAHLSDDTMMRNSCLTLCQFAIPNDVLFEYERLVRILLHGVADLEQEGFVQRIAIYLLNSLACQVSGKQKLFLGDRGAIKTMLNLIDDRLKRKLFDDVMEVAWSTMWNVTDETAVNCERFLNGYGMEYFLGCLRCFPDKEELLRNMMGLLGNVAEVKRLRLRLMTEEFINVFSNLLDSTGDGIEVSYNAAGVLAHIASDGIAAWTIASPTRSDVLKKLVVAINRWNLNAERNINYRSFEPIIGLLSCYETPECQHWAIWALANLTRVYPVKYCGLLRAEGGFKLLHEIKEHPKPYARIKELANVVLINFLTLNNEQQSDVSLDG